ncbi:hypothetical protein [[Clostridium] innocuum]|uniref:hypothetical protein n=1 Tax=Clostridium innocuum TaxID=1522 RepID=UPI003A4DE4E4
MDLFKHIFHVIRIVTVKEYPLSEIKQQIRNKVIGPGDRIRVKGYLSCFAPICEPDTFVPKMITYDRKHDEVHVVSCPPVVRNLRSEEYAVAFLYPQQGGRYEYELEDSAERLQITDKNRFIPVVLKKQEYRKFSEKQVEMICSIEDISTCDPKNEFIFKTREFRKVIDWFTDLYIPQYSAYCLKAQSILPDNNGDRKDSVIVPYAIEYQVSCNDEEIDLFEELYTALVKALVNENSRYKIWHMGEESHDFILAEDPSLKIVYKFDGKVGFYQNIDITDTLIYEQQMTLLEERLLQFKDHLHASIHLDLVYLSDIGMSRALDIGRYKPKANLA